MYHYFTSRGLTVPLDAVGDVAFNLLNEDGTQVKLSREQQELSDKINPALTLETLLRIASTKRVLLILHADNPILKLEIGRAALRSRCASDVVLGTRLAKLIEKSWHA
jgi:hypothetical protein